ncbi:MAG: hypothetical protein LBF16_13425 [Pseudomonadales bacterium]|jgi:hypothetical protein|nr:hypothetical protein [Pseudomonadales bacterium]
MFKSIKRSLLAVGIATAFYTTGSAFAHHSFEAEFDANLRGEFTGVVTEVRFANPHVRYRIDVAKADGTVENWELQYGSVTALRGQNWDKDTVKVGDTITVEGQLGREGAKKVYISGSRLSNGTATGTLLARAANAAPRPNNRNAVVNADPNKNYGYGQMNPSYPFDISGPWRKSYKFRVTVDDLDPKPTPFTEAGRRLREANQKYDDGALRCLSLGLPRIFGNPYNMDIFDAGDHYLFLYVEHNSPRRIWMDGRTPPADTHPTSNGYSVGHWEDGNTLVIETTSLLPGWLDGSGLPMSGEGTRTVERYVFNADHLAADATMTIYDPLYSQPLVRTRGMAREDNLDVTEQESCDPGGYYSDLLEAGLLEKYLKPQ